MEKMTNGKFSVENFKQMMELRESFAKNRFDEKIELSDHQFGNSKNLSGVKKNDRFEIMDKQDELNEKQHVRKMEQINTITDSKKR